MTPNEAHLREWIGALATELRALHPVRPPLLFHDECRVCFLLLHADLLSDFRALSERLNRGEQLTVPGVRT